MNKLNKKILLIILLVISIVVIIAANIGKQKTATASLLVETLQEAEVYINNENRGQTPYEDTFKNETLDLKIVPKDKSLKDFVTKIELKKGAKIIVRHKFATNAIYEETQILEIKKKTNHNASKIMVSSYPNETNIFINKNFSFKTPHTSDPLPSGIYLLTAEKEGYHKITTTIQLTKGYEVAAFFKLAKKQN